LGLEEIFFKHSHKGEMNHEGDKESTSG
jgi:hypothetical protein